MATHTPWTHQRPKASERIQNKPAGKNPPAGQQKQKSPEVKALHKLISNLQDPKSANDKDEEGCFCLAQIHSLSPHVPLCMACGMVLCDLNPPYRNCPYKPCSQPLLTPQARIALIERLNEKVAQIVEAEEEARRKEVEDQRKAEGAFPLLGKNHPQASKATQAPTQTHKILSLTSKGAVLTTVRKSTPPPVQPAKQDTTPVITRIKPPPPEPAHFAPTKSASPWQSLRAERLTYVPVPGKAKIKPKQSKKEEKKGVERDIQESGPSTR